MAVIAGVFSEGPRGEIETEESPARGSNSRNLRVKTITLELEHFIPIVRAMEKNRQYDLQLYLIRIALQNCPSLDSKLYHNVFQLCPTTHPIYMPTLKDLGAVIAWRQHNKGDFTELSDMDEALSIFRKVLPTLFPNHPNLFLSLKGYGEILRARFVQIRDPLDLENSRKSFEHLLQICPPHAQGDLGSGYYDLASTWWLTFEQSRSRSDLDKAVDYFRKCKAILPAGHGFSLFCSLHLFRTLHMRAIVFKTTTDIGYASRYLSEVLARYRYPDCVSILRECGKASFSFWERQHTLSHLDLAIMSHREAVQQSQSGMSDDHCELLHELAIYLQVRHNKLRRQEDMEMCLSHRRDRTLLTSATLKIPSDRPTSYPSLPHLKHDSTV